MGWVQIWMLWDTTIIFYNLPTDHHRVPLWHQEIIFVHATLTQGSWRFCTLLWAQTRDHWGSGWGSCEYPALCSGWTRWPMGSLSPLFFMYGIRMNNNPSKALQSAGGIYNSNVHREFSVKKKGIFYIYLKVILSEFIRSEAWIKVTESSYRLCSYRQFAPV